MVTWLQLQWLFANKDCYETDYPAVRYALPPPPLPLHAATKRFSVPRRHSGTFATLNRFSGSCALSLATNASCAAQAHVKYVSWFGDLANVDLYSFFKIRFAHLCRTRPRHLSRARCLA